MILFNKNEWSSVIFGHFKLIHYKISLKSEITLAQVLTQIRPYLPKPMVLGLRVLCFPIMSVGVRKLCIVTLPFNGSIMSCTWDKYVTEIFVTLILTYRAQCPLDNHLDQYRGMNLDVIGAKMDKIFVRPEKF